MRKPRKMLLGAAALLLPASAVVLGAGGTAFAHNHHSDPPPFSCNVSGNVAFNTTQPGLTDNGTPTNAKTATDAVTGSMASGAGCLVTNLATPNVTVTNLKCTGVNLGTNPFGGAPVTVTGCKVPASNKYYYGSFLSFSSTNSLKSIIKSLKKVPATVDGTATDLDTTAAGVANCANDGNGNPEIGFQIQGKVKAGPYAGSTDTLIACLDIDTVSGGTSKGSLSLDLSSGYGAPFTILSANIDPNTSVLEVPSVACPGCI